MFIGQFRPMAMKPPGEEQKEPEQAQTATQDRSPSSDEFLGSAEVKEFTSKWVSKMKDGKPVVTRRGVSDLLGSLFRNSSLSNKDTLKEADRILLRLTGLDGFSSVLSGLKAKSEGLIKGLKSLLGGK